MAPRSALAGVTIAVLVSAGAGVAAAQDESTSGVTRDIRPIESEVRRLQPEVRRVERTVTAYRGSVDRFIVEEAPKTVEIRLSTDLLFEFGKSEINPAAKAPLDEVAAIIRQNASSSVDIAGHTDAVGDDALNQRLSEQRAEAVRAYLAGPAGLSTVTFSTKGFGETQPIAINANGDGSDNPEGRQRNRRVTITYTKRG